MKFIMVFSFTIAYAFGRYVNEAENQILKKCTEGFQEFTDCVKYKAIKFLDNAIVNKKPIPLASFLYLTHDESTNATENIVEDEEEALKFEDDVNIKLDELLVKRVRRLVSTKNLQIKLDADGETAEGRKKKNKNKGMMMMMAGAGTMMMHAAMSKIAFIAGKALILAKIALVISALMFLKKMMSQDEHHETAQVIYKQAESGHGSGGGGGGGWHRSIENPESIQAHQMAYGGQVRHEPQE